MSIELAKQTAAHAAAQLILSHTLVGLGSGSTAAFFIEALGRRVAQGLAIRAVASSRASADLAQSYRIAVLDLNDVSHIDITVDGADEIDVKKRMIKGGGGAHVREKILAASSRELLIIVDEKKLVASVGVHKLPVEILPFGSNATCRKLEELGYRGAFRPTRTDNGNLLFDIQFPAPPASPEDEHQRIRQVPGVVDTGFFFNMAGRVIVGRLDGTYEIR